MALEPLPDERDARAARRASCPGCREAAVEAILARADGIPLYAVETVRALVADGRLEPDDGAYRPVGRPGRRWPCRRRCARSSRRASTPSSRPTGACVQDGRRARPDASPWPALAAVSGPRRAELEPRLRGLVRRELFELEADPRSPERGQYGFVQSLIREVAYGTLARRDRRARHLAAARYFESLGDDELAGALATHYLAAHEASERPGRRPTRSPSRRASPSRARPSAPRPSARHDQAVAYLRQALAVTTDSGRAGDAAPAGRHARRPTRATTRRRSSRSAAVSDFETCRRRRQRDGRATAELGAILLNGGDPGRRSPCSSGPRASLDRRRSRDEVRARLLANLSRALMRTDEAARSIEIADRALPDRRAPRPRAGRRRGLQQQGLIRSRVSAGGGRPVALLEAAVRIAQDGGFVAAELRARSNLASVAWSDAPRRAYRDAGDKPGTRPSGRQPADGELDGQLRRAGAWQTGRLGCGHRRGRGSARGGHRVRRRRRTVDLAGTLPGLSWRADRCGTRTARRDASASSDPGHAQALHLRVRRSLVRGDLEGVRRVDGPGCGLHVHGGCLPSAGDAAGIWLRDQRRAREVVERIAGAPDAGAPFATADRAASHAGLAAIEGRPDEAAAGYRDAFRRYRELGVEFYQAGSILDMVTLLGAATPERPLRPQKPAASSSGSGRGRTSPGWMPPWRHRPRRRPLRRQRCRWARPRAAVRPANS